MRATQKTVTAADWHPTGSTSKFTKAWVKCRGFVTFLALLGFMYGTGTLIDQFIEPVSGISLAVLTLLPEGQQRSGKSGSVVWLRNGVMRTKGFPALVQNAYTTAVRATLSGLSAAWRGLSQAVQDGW